MDKMKAFLPYFVEFNKDGLILLKVYLKNCIVGNLNKRPIIIITHNKSNFLANDGEQKV